MAAPTANVIAKRGARTLGIISFDPATPALQQYPINLWDLDDLAACMTAALQEMVAYGPQEIRNRDSGGWLNAPTQVSVACVQGSSAVTITTWAAWMLGCTIVITGDNYDNEINTQTSLARPYSGATGTATATVYADCIQLDDTINMVLPPVQVPPQWPLIAATTREEFMQISGYPLVTDSSGSPYGFPYWWFTQKAIGRPVAWFLDSYYDATSTFLPRRLRVGPMPNEAMPLAFRAGLNPLRILTTDIDNMGHTDPGVALPIPDSWVESLYYPIFVKKLSGLPQFRNANMQPEVDRSYRQAVKNMQTMGFGMGAVQQGSYI